MRKFSRLNESNKIDESEVDKLFSELGWPYEKYGYYYDTSNPENLALRNDIKDVKEHYANSILIVLNEPGSGAHFNGKKPNIFSMDIDRYNELGFNSSSFYFKTPDPQFYSKLFEILNKLKDHNPKVCHKDTKVLIFLEGEKIDDNIISIQKEMHVLYKKISDTLTEGMKFGFKDIIKLVNHYEERDNLYVTCVGSKASSILFASLCTHLSNDPRYIWIKKEKINEELSELREYVNHHGFNIKLKEDDWSKKNTYILTLEEI